MDCQMIAGLLDCWIARIAGLPTDCQDCWIAGLPGLPGLLKQKEGVVFKVIPPGGMPSFYRIRKLHYQVATISIAIGFIYTHQ